MLYVKIKKNKKDINDLVCVTEYDSGTIVKYTDKDGAFEECGIVIKDCDDENCILFDLNTQCYYSDTQFYYVIEELDATITIDN